MNYVYFKKMALKREMQLKAQKKSISGQKLGAQTEPSSILFYQETIMCNESLISTFSKVFWSKPNDLPPP